MRRFRPFGSDALVARRRAVPCISTVAAAAKAAANCRRFVCAPPHASRGRYRRLSWHGTAGLTPLSG
jgi:hypothetical protein